LTFPGLLSLEIEDFRNIESSHLRFAGGLNLITGANAAGKTSLLEAIYCLGRVQSFRSQDADRLTRHGRPGWRLVGRVGLPTGRNLPVGIERSAGRYRVRLDAQPVQRLSDLAGYLPVHVMAGETANILGGGPRYRRQSLDWALFHVEHGYREIWQRWMRCLRQRNAALRLGEPADQRAVWETELIDAALSIDRLRRAYLGELQPLLSAEMQQLLPGTRMELHYHAGWTTGVPLATALALSLDRDLARGYTHAGPQRADFSIQVDGIPVQAQFSRGQQKATVLAWLLAQVKLQQAHEIPHGVFLLDDVTSELDSTHQERLVKALDSLHTQAFVTAIEPHAVENSWPIARRFHVEHGDIQEVV
jgi:DNA replication and repair protein RecF